MGPTWKHLRPTWTHLAPTWCLLCPTWLSKAHYECNLALLGPNFATLATLRIELSPAQESNFHVLTLLPFKWPFKCAWTALGRLLGSTWLPLGLNLDTLEANLGALGVNLGALGAILDAPWSQLGRTCGQFRRTWGQLGRNWGQLRCTWGQLVYTRG